MVRHYVCAALAFGFFNVCGSAAMADTSALYEVTTSDDEDAYAPAIDFAMTVEVNDGGDARVHVTGRSVYLLIKGGEAYLVSRGIDGLYAERLTDLDSVIKARGEVGGLSLAILNELGGAHFVKTGKGKIGKWERGRLCNWWQGL